MAINVLLDGKDDQINYDFVSKKYSWILKKNQNCILSPDSDGLLCGLFLSHYQNWNIVGFYDGKVMVINKNYIDKSPVFLDIEIFRNEIRSMGHHMLLVNKRHIPKEWTGFDNCIQPNNLRNFDGKNNFRLKYPLGTIHMLISIIAYNNPSIKLPDTAIPPLFFTDGVFNILFKYPENVLNWLYFLRIHEEWNPLKSIFENDKYNVFNLMKEMDKFFRRRDGISVKNERGDRLRISNSDGSPANIENIKTGNCSINKNAKDRIVKFIKILSDCTEWKYDKRNWICWNNMTFKQFTKRDFNRDKKTITIKSFQEFIEKKPLSWAMTSGNNIEYTLEKPDKMIK